MSKGRRIVTSKDDVQELLERSHGDPDAKLIDDRKLQVFLAQEQSRIATKLNTLTLLLVVVGLLNVAVLAFQVWGK